MNFFGPKIPSRWLFLARPATWVGVNLSPLSTRLLCGGRLFPDRDDGRCLPRQNARSASGVHRDWRRRCLIAMESPSALDAQSIRDEKVKTLLELIPLSCKEVAASTVRGQYGWGEKDSAVLTGDRQEKGVDPRSTTETYVALQTKIDNWRWTGVPVLQLSGKRLPKRVSETTIEFRQPPLHLFHQLTSEDDVTPPKSNVLVIRIQPDEGISLDFACKRPGMWIQLEEVNMDFFYRTFQQRSPEAYERLLLDALRGDASLFTRSDEVEYAWRFISSIHEGWANLPPPKFPNYYPFTDGPDEANRLLEGTGT